MNQDFNNNDQNQIPKPNLVPNYTYGVDTNDKAAVYAEYKRLKRRHRIITFLSIIAIGILGFFAFDFVRVNFLNQKPIIAIKSRVDLGDLYTGIGYKILYCDNGEVYKAVVDKDKCNMLDDNTFDGIFYNSLVKYLKENKIYDQYNVASFEILNKELDENFDDNSSDYLVDIRYTCLDGGSSCIKTLKEKDDQNNFRLFVNIDKENKVDEIYTFKDTGNNYEQIRKDYEDKIRQYKINNEMLVEENLRSFTVRLLKNYGRFKYQDTMYSDAYLVSIDYLCVDNTNTCVSGENVESDNLYLEEIALLDSNNDVILMKNPRIMN